jgi:hypothetical protein
MRCIEQIIMNSQNKYLAEAALQHLLLGAQVNGIRFEPNLQLLIKKSNKILLQGQIYLSLESRWTLCSTPEKLPAYEDDIPIRSVEEELKTLFELREQIIVDVQLGELSPHLMLRLASGYTFFINGTHDCYECWQVGVSMDRPQESWRIVSCPGDDIAVWAPQQFVDFVLTPEAGLMLV